jgi:hypothetical protein
MAFRPFKWIFNPPKTVPPVPAPPPLPSAPAPRDSRAARLIGRLGELRETARYLEGLIVERTRNMGVQFDLSADPELAMALERIYGEAPEGVSIEMYNHLLDAQVGTVRAEIALGESEGPWLVDPVQKADLQRVNDAVENALVEEGSFEHQLPLLLRPLKNDRVIFDNLEEGLGQYPILKAFQSSDAVTVEVEPGTFDDQALGDTLSYEVPRHDDNGDIALPVSKNDDDNRKLVSRVVASIQQEQAPPLDPDLPEQDPADVDPDTDANLEDRFDLWEAYYENTLDLASQVDSAYRDVHNFAQAYLYRPLAELEYVLKMLAALKVFFHKPKLKDLRAGLASFIMPRLVSEIAKFNFMVDRAVQAAVMPVEQLIRSLGRLFGEIQKDGNYIAYLALQNGFTGMVRSHITGKYQMPEPREIEKLDTIPAGLAALGSKLSWGLREMTMQRDYVEASMVKALDSKLAGDGDRLEVMQSLRSIDALVNITKGYLEVGYRNVGYGMSGGSGPIEDIERRVDQFVRQNGAADLPTVNPPAAAQAVFDRARERKENQNA